MLSKYFRDRVSLLFFCLNTGVTSPYWKSTISQSISLLSSTLQTHGKSGREIVGCLDVYDKDRKGKQNLKAQLFLDQHWWRQVC